MTVSFETFLPEVMPEVIGCPEQIVINAVRNATDEFCKATNIWKYTHDPMASIAGVAEYELDVPSHAQVASVLSVKQGDWMVEGKSEDWLNSAIHDWQDQESTSSAYYTFETPPVIRLVPYPSATVANDIRVRVSLRPTPNASKTDSALYNEWHEVIAHGALSRLKAMTDKPWTDLNGVAYHKSLFLDQVGKATIQSQRNSARTGMRAQPQFFGV